LRLPTEILLHIFKVLDTIDAVCLALACKHLLQVSAMLTIRVPSVAKHQCLLPSTCHRIFELLWRFEPRVDRGRWSEAKKFGLCYDCLQYRPRKKTHWKLFARKHRRIRGVRADSWTYAVNQWADRYSAQCPECYCMEKYPALTT
jgi:hypothetical protein